MIFVYQVGDGKYIDPHKTFVANDILDVLHYQTFSVWRFYISQKTYLYNFDPLKPHFI